MLKKILIIQTFVLLLIQTLSADPTLHQITTTGFCTKDVTPDRGRIMVTVEFRKATVKDAVAQATQAYEKLRTEIKNLNLPDLELQTSEYAVTEIREWEKDKSVFKGYSARMGLNIVSSDLNRLGEVIAVAGKLSVQNVGGLEIFVSNALYQKEQNSCLSIAAGNARDKAQKIAEGLGVQLGSVLAVNEGSEMAPQVQQVMYMKAQANRDSAPVIESGKRSIQVSISASFEVK